MPRTKAETAAYYKQYNIDNRERVAANKKQWNIDNREKKAASYNQWMIDNPAKYKKSEAIRNWKASGIKGDLSFIYDCAYITAYECWVCKKAFKSTYDRCLDHNHDSGEFRNVLCRSCNTMDYWMKY